MLVVYRKLFIMNLGLRDRKVEALINITTWINDRIRRINIKPI